MWVKTQSVALSMVCSAAVVAASTAPVVTTTHAAEATPIRSAAYRYALTAAAIDAAFDPIRYLGNVGGAAQAVASDVIYWQTPDFPLLVLSAQVDPGTGQYDAVQKVTSTTTHLQNLVGAVTAFPGASSSPQVQQMVSGIGSAGAAAAGATQTVTATLAPHLAPLTPVIYVVRVLHAAVGVYYAVATLSTTGLGTVLGGQNPLTAVANVVSSVQGLANVLAHAPQPAPSAPAPTASQLVAKSTAAAGTRPSTELPASTSAPRPSAGETNQLQSRAAADVSGKRSHKTAEPANTAESAGSVAKSPDTQPESSSANRKSAAKRPADDAVAPKSATTPAKPKTSTADKSESAPDSQGTAPAATAKKPTATAKSDDHKKPDTAAGQTDSTPKTKNEHGRPGD